MPIPRTVVPVASTASTDLRSASKLMVAVDVNAVPPPGIEGVGVNDKGKVLEMTPGKAVGIGALAAGIQFGWIPAAVVRGAVLVGLCAAAAAVLYQLAVRGELVSITAVIASLYPALTVVLAAVVLHERMHRKQGIGLALAAGAVVLVALA